MTTNEPFQSTVQTFWKLKVLDGIPVDSYSFCLEILKLNFCIKYLIKQFRYLLVLSIQDFVAFLYITCVFQCLHL